MIATDELNDYLEEYLEEKQEVKNLTQETIKKQTFNISKFINFLEFLFQVSIARHNPITTR